jgi:putative transposase
MPRRARLSLPGVPHHLVQRGNNKVACFYTPSDYQIYLEWLQLYAHLFHCRVHAYVLMTNHVHLLLTPDDADGLGLLMKRLGQRYVQYINRTYGRTGSLWEGRYKSCIVGTRNYILACYRYIELNPVRADMVNHPSEYRWSSYRINAQSETSSLVQQHAVYLLLGKDSHSRNLAYRGLLDSQLEDGIDDQIRKSTNGNFALGSENFKLKAEAALARRVSPGRSGRPRKSRAKKPGT